MGDPRLTVVGGDEELPLAEIGESFGRFRVVSPKAQHRLEASVRAYGQLSPAVVLGGGSAPFELIDGFKRLRIARSLTGVSTLRVVRLTLGPRAAKAAVVQINRTVGRVSDFEEALVLSSLAQEDGLTQVEIGGLFGKDQSWVSRRIALAERLCDEAKEQIRLGLLGMASGRELVSMPRGIQPKVLETLQRHDMTSREAARLTQKLLASPQTKWDEILRFPDDVLGVRLKAVTAPSNAPLSPAALGERLTRLAAHCRAVSRDLGRITESMAADGELAEAGEHTVKVMSRTIQSIRRVTVIPKVAAVAHA